MSSFISNLNILNKIGNGHFGEVFLANDDVHGHVAVKVLARMQDEPDVRWHARRDGLLREAQFLARATHRNVVPVYHCVASDDGESIRFCMALCPRGSLQTEFERAPMSLLNVRKIATEVTLGLQALHQRGMLHRDIKPANILLDGSGTAQLGDFGLVTDDLLFGYGSANGYLDHIAYEVWHGEPTSIKTDIWALGMTLYRLLHGKTWYELRPLPRAQIALGRFADSLRWLPHIPQKWRRTLRKMMNDDTSARYQNCEQLLSALADLPVEPDWECAVESTKVHWHRVAKTREFHTEWIVHSPRKHEWKAWSAPRGAGITRRLAGSTGTIGRTACVDELEAFFTSHASNAR
jgi:eukaryotic-like serine/threonine-protein kinase